MRFHTLDPRFHYNEADLNEALKTWRREFGKSFGLDHKTLRRILIDDRFITHDEDDSSYAQNVDTPACIYGA